MSIKIFFQQVHIKEQILTFHAAAKSLQLCLTLCDPIDSSPLGSPIPGILQARTLEWVAISFSTGEGNIPKRRIRTYLHVSKKILMLVCSDSSFRNITFPCGEGNGNPL